MSDLKYKTVKKIIKMNLLQIIWLKWIWIYKKIVIKLVIQMKVLCLVNLNSYMIRFSFQNIKIIMVSSIVKRLWKLIHIQSLWTLKKKGEINFCMVFSQLMMMISPLTQIKFRLHLKKNKTIILIIIRKKLTNNLF